MTPDSPDNQAKDKLYDEILSIVHLCGCQAMNADLEKVERLEHTTTIELVKLFEQLIAQEANKARLDELSLLLKLTEAVLKENNNEKLFAIRVTKEFDSTIRTRIAQLTAEKESSDD